MEVIESSLSCIMCGNPINPNREDYKVKENGTIKNRYYKPDKSFKCKHCGYYNQVAWIPIIPKPIAGTVEYIEFKENQKEILSKKHEN